MPESIPEPLKVTLDSGSFRACARSGMLADPRAREAYLVDEAGNNVLVPILNQPWKPLQ
jgi:hypothetical protein